MDAPSKRKRWAEQDTWDRENMATLGCKVKKIEAQAFKDYAASQGKTANTVLKEYVMECISHTIDEKIERDKEKSND
jgi:hypothetical protein